MKKKFGIFLMALSICLGLLHPEMTVQAAAGATSVGVSTGSVNIGDTVTVTAKASGPSGEKVVATMTLSYDAAILQYVGCSVTAGGGGGSVTAAGDSFTVTFQAVGAGTSALSLTGTDGVIFDTNTELDSMGASSASVTVNNAAGGGNTGGGQTGGGTGGNAGDNAGGGNTGGSAGGGNAGGGQTGGNAGGSQTPAAPLSADNSLKSLTLSAGTLSPSFSGKNTKYSAAVGNDVTSIAVSAAPVNEKAAVVSVTGHEGLKVGANTIRIVVKAENGVTATYTVNVTRAAAGGNETPSEQPEETPSGEEAKAETVTVNGAAYQIAEDFAAEDIPADFVETTINYHGNDYKGVSFQQGVLNMLWMKEDGADGAFFVYDGTRDVVYPYVRLSHGERYVIPLLPPVDFAVPKTCVQTSFVSESGAPVTAYQEAAEEETELESGFYLFYAVNDGGTEGWYRYDSLEETYQRYVEPKDRVEEAVENEALEPTYTPEEYTALADKYKKEKSFARNVIGILIFVLAVLLVVILNLLLKRAGGESNEDDLDEDVWNEEKERNEDAFWDVQRGRRKLADADFQRHMYSEEHSAGRAFLNEVRAELKEEIIAGRTGGSLDGQNPEKNMTDAQAPEKYETLSEESFEPEDDDDDDLEMIDFNDL